jgi:hypothetical protein
MKALLPATLLLASVVAACSPAGTTSSTPSTSAYAEVAKSARGAPLPLATGSPAGYLDWSFLGSDIFRIRLADDKEYRLRYGVGGGWGLARDDQGYVYESFGNDGPFQTGPTGIAVLDEKLGPARTIELPNWFLPVSLTVDARQQTYIGCEPLLPYEQYFIEEFAANASGTASPVRTLEGSKTGLSFPIALVTNSSGDLYVADAYSQSGTNDVRVFAPDAKWNAAPVRVIGGSQTGITNPTNLAFGPDGYLYVANLSSLGTFEVLVFRANANGNVAPLRSLESTTYGETIALDANGDMYAGAGRSPNQGFAIFAPGASGNAQPIGYVGPKHGFTYPEYPQRLIWQSL